MKWIILCQQTSKYIYSYEEWRSLQKKATRIEKVFCKRENKFVDEFNNIFDIAISKRI